MDNQNRTVGEREETVLVYGERMKWDDELEKIIPQVPEAYRGGLAERAFIDGFNQGFDFALDGEAALEAAEREFARQASNDIQFMK